MSIYYCILQTGGDVQFIAMPQSHLYQLVALLHRLHKEIGKLTASDLPVLPTVLGECSGLELYDNQPRIVQGLAYLNTLEELFADLKEDNYPLISLLTEIRALQAQLEYLEEENEEE